ncbi:hypothetical protein [Hoeflea prorocentri]|uniref:Uncharacterized protein n=1 Tax=Hoeflea prorocentri TaxID=1922333 RepID=A0A9X3ZJL1_9HYPH|nr:hypothetical protein [Hoeflea prorocentri]MCY6383203.1 hypothetical protein [Hoeflea prorocentri]MDA5401003.1 hypothetical protein [Hoeflea prorocentri]
MADHDDQSRKALQDLEKLKDEGNLLHAPKLKTKSKTVTGHFMAKDVDPSDKIEVWGTRIGRILSLIALVALVIWLANFLQSN